MGSVIKSNVNDESAMAPRVKITKEIKSNLPLNLISGESDLIEFIEIKIPHKERTTVAKIK